MSEPLYDVIFRGDILPGHQLLQVKSQLQQLFRCDEARIQALFTGGVVPLKLAVDGAAAQRYQQALAAAGADVQVVPAGSVKPAARRVRPPSPVVSSDRAGARRESLKERLAASQAPPATGSATPAPAAAAPQSGTDDWSLSPAGSDLLRATERRQQVAADVDTSSLSLRPQQGNLLDDDELPRLAPVRLGQIDFELEAPGSDLLRDNEKRVVPPAKIELPDMGLAPAGSDLGQLKPAPPPPPPDTSGLELDPEN